LNIPVKFIVFSLLNVVLTLPLSAQSALQEGGLGNALFAGNKMAAVIVVLVIILLGLAIFLVSMERRIKKMEDDQ